MSSFNINFQSLPKFHFIGIGGVSMSGLAIALHNIGCHVSGSDATEGKYSRLVEQSGITVSYGHKAENLSDDINYIIETSTVPMDNPEILKANSVNIPILQRWQLIAEMSNQYKTVIGITGSSGKTTTTALIWEALKSNGHESSLFLGTILNEVSSSIAISAMAQTCIIEADESDAGFSYMKFDICVLTDIDGDHLEHKEYGGKYDKLIERFKVCIQSILEKNGTIIYNRECETLRNLVESIFNKINLGKIISYGLNSGDQHINNFKHTNAGSTYDASGMISVKNILLPMIGQFNAMNSVPGIIIANLFNNTITNNIYKDFQGIDKRLTFVGKHKNVTVMDDYAHSPKKIRTLIRDFKEYADSIDADFIIFCEPHKYTRLAQMYEEYLTCFDDATTLVLLDIFGIIGGMHKNITKEILITDIKKYWTAKNISNKHIFSLQNNNNMFETDFVMNILRQKRECFFVFIGAGFSSKLSRKCLEAIIRH